ncbi:MAG: hypothetical protein U5P10_00025 [Spirochaetia bacterium]|nr:hypothetical protein [Spirochaetia bacterium]
MGTGTPGWPEITLNQWQKMTPSEISNYLDTNSVNARDEDGITALMYAAKWNSNTDVLQALLKAGAEVNRMHIKDTFISELTYWIHYVMEALLKAKVNSGQIWTYSIDACDN